MSAPVPLSAQVSALALVADRQDLALRLKTAGIAPRLAECELLAPRLAAALGTLRWLAEMEPYARALAEAERKQVSVVFDFRPGVAARMLMQGETPPAGAGAGVGAGAAEPTGGVP